MTLKHMKIFLAVCEYGGVTKAAKELYLAQPSVSLAIKELEEHYNIKLFDRLSRKLYLTEYGKLFYIRAKAICDTYNSLETEMSSKSATVPVRVGTSITIGNRMLPDWISRYSTAYFGKRVISKIDSSRNIVEKILKGELDFAAIEGKVDNEDIIAEPFSEDNLALFAGKGHPLWDCEAADITELTKYDFALREKGSGTRDFFDSILTINDISVNIVCESISSHALLEFVARGLAVSVCPRRLAEDYIENGRIKEIKLKGASLKRSFYIVKHKNKELTADAKSFISIIKNG